MRAAQVLLSCACMLHIRILTSPLCNHLSVVVLVSISSISSIREANCDSYVLTAGHAHHSAPHYALVHHTVNPAAARTIQQLSEVTLGWTLPNFKALS